jgi:glutamyl endopeptidase
MPPRGHRPMMSTTPRRIRAEAIEVPEAAILHEEPVVLPYYRSPRARRAERDEATLEAFPPENLPASPVRDAAEGSFGETTVLEVVIGNDDRVRLDDALTRSNPWRQICALRIRAATGTDYVGTAWFIGPRILATAGHCVFLRNEGGWATSIEVIPGKFGPNEPYDRATGTRFGAVDGWIDTGGRDFDYGVILLDDATIGSRVGNFAVEAAPDGELVGVTSRISGYPADRDRAEFQYYHERPVLSVTPTRISYDIDTFGGQSGSPIWRQIQGSPAVAIGIHTTGGLTSNSGTRISEAVLDNLIRWSEESSSNA